MDTVYKYDTGKIVQQQRDDIREKFGDFRESIITILITAIALIIVIILGAFALMSRQVRKSHDNAEKEINLKSI